MPKRIWLRALSTFYTIGGYVGAGRTFYVTTERRADTYIKQGKAVRIEQENEAEYDKAIKPKNQQVIAPPNTQAIKRQKEIITKPQQFKLEHVGGGWYELPNGEKIQGKKNAEARMKKLNNETEPEETEEGEPEPNHLYYQRLSINQPKGKLETQEDEFSLIEPKRD